MKLEKNNDSLLSELLVVPSTTGQFWSVVNPTYYELVQKTITTATTTSGRPKFVRSLTRCFRPHALEDSRKGFDNRIDYQHFALFEH
jgi:hypothetical protein